MNAQFKKGALELCVLSQLALRDQYGYELTENISKEMKLAAGRYAVFDLKEVEG